MLRSPEEKKRAIARLRRIRGQAEALERAVEADTSCAALLQQIVAMRGATNGLMTQVMESHMRDTYGRKRAEAMEDIDADIIETMTILRTYFK